MLARQKQVIEAYQRVQDFLAANPAPPPASYGVPKQLLDQAVERLTEHSTDQVSGRRMSRAETQRQKKLRKSLRELHLRPISKIAKASLADAPGIDKALIMPSELLSTTRLISEANGIRDAAAPYAAVFIRNGRPEDFLAKFDAAVEELRQSQLGRSRNVGKGVGAKAGLKDEIQRGRDAVEMLDAIVTTSFASAPDVLAKWRIARRIQGLPGGGGGAVAPVPADPTVPSQPKAA